MKERLSGSILVGAGEIERAQKRLACRIKELGHEVQVRKAT